MPLQIQNRVFIENDPRSAGMVGKVLGTGLSSDGQDIIFYAVYNMMGQLINPKDSTTVETFNRYFKAGKLLWRG